MEEGDVNMSDVDGKSRFEVELEFVQCLASPSYLHFLAQNWHFEDEDFLEYLTYLQYWRKPEYAKFIVFPQCLYFLRLLQEEKFRASLKRQDYYTFLHNQQGYMWQFARTLKPKGEQAAPKKEEAMQLGSGKEEPMQLVDPFSTEGAAAGL